jgi:hypothetical protein
MRLLGVLKQLHDGERTVICLELPRALRSLLVIVERCVHAPRHDHGDSNVIVAHIEHHRLRHAEDSELARVVSGSRGERVSARQRSDVDDVPVLYGFATAWASWIQVNKSDWNALAGLPKLTALFEHCIALDEQFDYGGAHIYLGVLSTQLPPALGGKPEQGREHFERAIEISAGKNLMIKVLMAENYARMVFNQELHDQLLQSVLSDPAESPGLTLTNNLAKQQASILLAESSDFF